MHFYHSDEIWNRFPALSALVFVLHGVRAANAAAVDIGETLGEVAARLEKTAEADLPSIIAWRQAYSAMGLKPTQYRCAVEALLRRFRKDKDLPRFHPLVDVLNAESMQAAIPIAAFDCRNIVGGICVRPATGAETHRSFQGDIEHPAAGEIIFADAADQAHSRRWVFRQGAASVVSKESDTVLIVAEALHDTGAEDLAALRDRIGKRAAQLGIASARQALLTRSNRRFEFTPGA
ncbi:B3/B4 domain-containing protein [Verminephrobacter eiseniae]|uniref:B3/B4 domain-containing protein n=1 Tax=Verminephrobacter eiseniae TaxID=364317 RepID=UPI002237F0CA|nr:phenylalanine--tRNA ligase beta subunit-related protein [Verminephrobacter eiseniae]